MQEKGNKGIISKLSGSFISTRNFLITKRNVFQNKITKRRERERELAQNTAENECIFLRTLYEEDCIIAIVASLGVDTDEFEANDFKMNDIFSNFYFIYLSYYSYLSFSLPLIHKFHSLATEILHFQPL